MRNPSQLVIHGNLNEEQEDRIMAVIAVATRCGISADELCALIIRTYPMITEVELGRIETVMRDA